MIVTSPTVTADAATLRTIDIGQVRVGPITVGELVVNNTNVATTGASAVLHGVSVAISIHISAEWHVHVGMPDWIPDIDIGDTYDLGSLDFGPFGVGDVNVPQLNASLNIPNIAGNGLSANVTPLPLSLSNAVAERIEAHNVRLPAGGFTLAGLGLGSAQVNDVSVPATTVEQASVARLTGDTIQIPALALSGVNIAGLQIPRVSSTAPLDIPATLETRSVGFDAGILSLGIHLTPGATSHIDALEINNANATATVGEVALRNVVLPYEVLNLTLSQIGVSNLVLPAINAS